jgi:hypothetical protein
MYPSVAAVGFQNDQNEGSAASAARAPSAMTPARINMAFRIWLSSAFAMATARAMERLRYWFMDHVLSTKASIEPEDPGHQLVSCCNCIQKGKNVTLLIRFLKSASFPVCGCCPANEQVPSDILTMAEGYSTVPFQPRQDRCNALICCMIFP